MLRVSLSVVVLLAIAGYTFASAPGPSPSPAPKFPLIGVSVKDEGRANASFRVEEMNFLNSETRVRVNLTSGYMYPANVLVYLERSKAVAFAAVHNVSGVTMVNLDMYYVTGKLLARYTYNSTIWALEVDTNTTDLFALMALNENHTEVGIVQMHLGNYTVIRSWENIDPVYGVATYCSKQHHFFFATRINDFKYQLYRVDTKTKKVISSAALNFSLVSIEYDSATSTLYGFIARGNSSTHHTELAVINPDSGHIARTVIPFLELSTGPGGAHTFNSATGIYYTVMHKETGPTKSYFIAANVTAGSYTNHTIDYYPLSWVLLPHNSTMMVPPFK